MQFVPENSRGTSHSIHSLPQNACKYRCFARKMIMSLVTSKKAVLQNLSLQLKKHKHFSQVVAQHTVVTSSSQVLNSQRFDFVPTVVSFILEYLNAVVNRLKKLKSLLDLVWNSLSFPRYPCLLTVCHPPLVSWGRLWAWNIWETACKHSKVVASLLALH